MIAAYPSETDVTGEAFDQPPSPLRTKLFICGSQRTGSYLLCRAMIHHGMGVPHEYFNTIHIAVLGPRWGIAELKEPAKNFSADSGDEPQSLGASVEQYLTQYFLAQGERLPPPGVYDRIVQEVERPLISICLAATRGNQIRAAQLLGLNRNTLRKKIRDLGLEVIRGLRTE